MIFLICRTIVDATADLVCAFKPQIAHFASQRGEAALERICSYIRADYPDVTLILDSKRGDIGSTAEHYAREAFGRYGAHAVTVNPYLGTDSIEPYLAHGGGILVVCRTSNPGGDDVQSLVVDDGRPVYAHVAEMVATRWSELGDCGVVASAVPRAGGSRRVAPGTTTTRGMHTSALAAAASARFSARQAVARTPAARLMRAAPRAARAARAAPRVGKALFASVACLA